MSLDRPRIRAIRRWLSLGAVLLLAACKGATIPDEDPYISGPIESIMADGRLRVAPEPGEECGAVVAIGERTRIRARSGAVVHRDALVAGRRVSVWIDGPVLESCPTQVAARFIVLERD